MSLLVNLNQEGFLSIKNDRQKIKSKIDDLSNEIISLQTERKQLEEMLKEFEKAHERLVDFYEPKIRVKRIKTPKGDRYIGIAGFKYPKRTLLQVNLGSVNEFKGDDDKNLITLAEKKMKELIKTKFPLYF